MDWRNSGTQSFSSTMTTRTWEKDGGESRASEGRVTKVNGIECNPVTQIHFTDLINVAFKHTNI